VLTQAVGLQARCETDQSGMLLCRALVNVAPVSFLRRICYSA
jgi:hypothetical protein